MMVGTITIQDRGRKPDGANEACLAQLEQVIVERPLRVRWRTTASHIIYGFGWDDRCEGSRTDPGARQILPHVSVLTLGGDPLIKGARRPWAWPPRAP
jgi:hypothetical protein